MSDAKFYAIVTYYLVAGGMYGLVASTLYFVFHIGSVILWGVLLLVQAPLHAYVAQKILEIPDAK